MGNVYYVYKIDMCKIPYRGLLMLQILDDWHIHKRSLASLSVHNWHAGMGYIIPFTGLIAYFRSYAVLKMHYSKAISYHT